MSTAPYMTLGVLNSNALVTSPLFTRAHTVAFVSRTDDGCLSLRFSGPARTGTATLPGHAPLSAVLREVWAATGLGGVGETVETNVSFVPSHGSKASTPYEVHGERAYTLFVRSSTPLTEEAKNQLADLLRDY